MSQTWKPYLQTAAGAANDNHNDWDQPYPNPPSYDYHDQLKPQIVSSSVDPAKCPPTSGRVEVCNASYGQTGWLGVASIWISGSHITQGTTKLNDSYYTTGSKYDNPGWRNLVTCQEVGHTFGLDHQDETFGNTNLGTCMDYTNSPTGGGSNGSADNEYPNQGDYDQLTCIYDPAMKSKRLTTSTHRCRGTGHLDSSTTIGANAASKHPAAMNRMDNGDPKQWGRLLHKNGRYEVYERDFGNGNKVRTWVIKSDETDVAPEGTTRPGATNRPEPTGPVSAPTT